jgi:hypothetical protein
VLGDILEALRALRLKIVQELVDSSGIMGFTVAAEINRILSLKKLVFVGRGVQGANQLTGSSLIKINLKVLMAGMPTDLASIGLDHPHSALLDLEYIANEEELSIDGESHTEEASFIDIDLI